MIGTQLAITVLIVAVWALTGWLQAAARGWVHGRPRPAFPQPPPGTICWLIMLLGLWGIPLRRYLPHLLFAGVILALVGLPVMILRAAGSSARDAATEPAPARRDGPSHTVA